MEENVKMILAKLGKLDEVLNDTKKIREELEKTQKDLSTVQDDLAAQKEMNAKNEGRIALLEDKIDQLENQSRRNNLIIRGVPEKRGESWNDCKKTVTWIAADMGLKIHPRAIERAHRLKTDSTPRPIIAKFTYHQDKEDMLKYQKYLEEPWNEIVIKEDFSKTVREERKILGAYMMKARKEGNYATLNYNKLQIEEETFRYNKDTKRIEKIGDKKKPPQSAAGNKRKRDLRAGTDSPVNATKVSREDEEKRERKSHQPKQTVAVAHQDEERSPAEHDPQENEGNNSWKGQTHIEDTNENIGKRKN